MFARWAVRAAVVGSLGFALLGFSAGSAIAAGSLVWSSPVLVDQLPEGGAGIPFTSISCPSASLCVAVDEVGNVLTATRSTTGAVSWKSAPVDSGALLNWVSCESTVACYAVDNRGNFLWTQNPAGGAAAWRRRNIDGQNELLSVACPSTSLCVATDHQGNLLSSVDPAGSSAWQSVSLVPAEAPPQYNSLISLWCQSNSLCVGGQAGAGSIWSSTQPTGAADAWQAAGNVIMGLTSMSCNAQGLCVAGSDIGDIASSVNPAGGLNAWHVIGPVLGPITATACALPAFCVAADKSGALASSSDPTGGIPSWQRLVVDSTAITAISCASQALCVAVDGAGRALVGQPPVAPKCVVPNVIGDSLSSASKAISAAHCAVGRVTTQRKPKHKPPRHKKWNLVVGKQSPPAGSIRPAGSKVALRLVYKAQSTAPAQALGLTTR